MTDQQPDFYEDDEPLEDILAILNRAPVGYTTVPSTAAAIADLRVSLVEHLPAAPRGSSRDLGSGTYVVPPERIALPA